MFILQVLNLLFLTCLGSQVEYHVPVIHINKVRDIVIYVYIKEIQGVTKANDGPCGSPCMALQKMYIPIVVMYLGNGHNNPYVFLGVFLDLGNGLKITYKYLFLLDLTLCAFLDHWVLQVGSSTLPKGACI